MSPVAVIPVKSFETGYSRLSEAVSADARRALGMSIAGRVASESADAGCIPLIVTADPEVAQWAIQQGFPSIPDPGSGLNAAVDAGVEWSRGSGTRWIALHADLPLISREDILELTETRRDVIAPSADGGTSALSADGQIEFRYGRGSFHGHLSQLNDPRIVVRTGLLHDIDTPRDLRAATTHPQGDWLTQVLGRTITNSDGPC